MPDIIISQKDIMVPFEPEKIYNRVKDIHEHFMVSAKGESTLQVIRGRELGQD